MRQLYYVAHFQGQIDGKGPVYKSVTLSDGLRAMKAKVSDQIADLNQLIENQGLKEGDRVDVEYDIASGKNEVAVMVVNSIVKE